MALELPSQEHMAQVVAGMRETIRARAAIAPEPVNLDAAAALSEWPPLLWNGVLYTVRKIGYREGLMLSKRMKAFNSLAHAVASDPESDALDRHIELFDEVVDQFWSFLDPKPSTNPFLELAPLEVGAVAGFFFTCLRIQNHPSQLERIQLSPSITSTQ